jgi:hypothetical protein
MKYLRFYIIAVIISTLAFSALVLPRQVLGAGNGTVRVSAPTEAVAGGTPFTVSILVEPISAIAGAQFNLGFNPALVTVNSVAEGNLFKQNGASTYFFPGAINNNSGTISGACGVIITPGQTISIGGTLAVVNCTAKSGTGTSQLNLSNVVVGDINGQVVPLSVVNGQVGVNTIPASPNPTPTSIPTPSPSTAPSSGPRPTTSSNPPANGGNSGDRQYLTEYMILPGVFSQDVTLKTYDGIINLFIPQNTNGKTAEGWALSYLVLKPAESVNQRPGPQDESIVGLAYDLGPEGTVFDPPIKLSIIYDPAKIPAGFAETDLIIGYWDETTGHWIKLDGCQVNTTSHVITVPLSHFSIYVVVAYPSEAPTTIASILPTSSMPLSLAGNDPVYTATPEKSSIPNIANSVTDEPEYPVEINSANLPVRESMNSSDSITPASPINETKEISLWMLAEITGISMALASLVAFTIIFIRHRLVNSGHYK